MLVGGQGSGGVDGNGTSGGGGGKGAQVIVDIPVQPGQILGVQVAQNGFSPNQGEPPNVTGGANGGSNEGGQGGGASGVWLGSSAPSGSACSGYGNPGDMFAVAGGGGGGGAAGTLYSGSGGGEAGHDLDGQASAMNGADGNGLAYLAAGGGGGGATATGGGSGGANGNASGGGNSGSAFAGGAGKGDTGGGDGGGGGGGYYGGGGGGDGGGSGGGGGAGAGSSVVLGRAQTESIASTSNSPMVSLTPVSSPPDSLYTVAAGNNFSCALKADGTVACWGDNSSGQSTPPSGTFTSLSAGSDSVCGIRTDNTVACWGDNTYNQTNAPPGQFQQVSVGDGFACGLRVTSTVSCWGQDDFSGPGLYTAISSGSDYLCELTYDQHAACFGATNLVPQTTPTGDQFTLISSGLYAPCGILTDGTSVCWGGSYAPTPIPAGPFSGLSTASFSGNMCWIGTDGTLQCATSPYGTSLPAPPNGGAFSAVSMGYAHACAAPATGGVVCWGDNSKGEASPFITAAWPDPHAAVPPPAAPGQSYTFALTTTYESPAATFSLTGGGLPPGLTLNPSGVLAGTPTAVGDYNFTVSAGNGAAPGATLTTHLLVTQAPAITSANHATFVAGSAGNFAVTTTGEPAAALSESGALPAGVTFIDNGDGTASLGGTPAAHSGGVYALTLNARNGVSPDASQAFTLTVNEAPSFTSANSAAFGLNTTNTFTVTAQGYPTPALSESGALPAGVTFDAATGRLSGTPSGSGDTYTPTFTAHNGVGADASQTFTLTTVPWVARAPLPDGREYLATATGTDGTLYAIGGYDASANPQSAVYALAPGASSWRSVAPLPLGLGDGRAYAAAATGLDGTIYLIGGVDHYLAAQSSVFAYTPATNSWRSVASLPNGGRADLAATTGADGTIYALGGWSGQTGSSSNRQQYYNTVFAYNPTAKTWSTVAALPEARYGLAAATGADGTIYALGGANASFTAQSTVYAYTPAMDSWSQVADLPGARVDLAATTGADGTIDAIGGADASNTLQSSVYAYSPATGNWAPLPTLPDGLSGLGAATGADGAIYAIGGQGDNGVAQTTTLAYYPPPIPPTIGSATSATFAVGTPGTFTVTASGRPVPALSESGALPSGVTFTNNGDGTATLSGTPARGAGGSYPLTVTAHSGAQPDATQRFTLTVTNPLPATSGISPAAVQAGGGAIALTVSGANFVPGSTVRVTTAGGTSTMLTPSAVAPDGTQLTVTIPAAAIATAGTRQVTVLNAAPGGGTSTLQPLFVTAANAAVASTSSSASGVANTGGTGPNTAGSVTVSGTGGSGTIAVAIYAANPGGTPSFAASGGYFDAYVAPGSTYSSVRIVDCALHGGSQAFWYNASTATWTPASNQSYDPVALCTTITVTASSTPSLAQLGGTPFGIANVPPVVAAPGPQNAQYGRTLSFTVTATDVEPGDGVTLAASGLPAGLSLGPTTFNQATGHWIAMVSGTVSALAGVYPISITANDGYSTSAAQTVPVTVKLFATGSLLALSQDGASCHLLLNGGATVSAAGAATVNGTSGSALCLNSATFSASTITVQGGVRNNNSTVQGMLLTRQPATADLLATLPAPTAPAAACPGAACPDGITLNSGRTYRLLPGAYTAAITANSGATVCVAPGVYVLKASWTLNSAALRPYGSAGCPAAPSGTSDPGVLLYFAQGHAQVNGSGDFSRLRAMVSGPYAGLLYWQADSESTALNGSVGFAGGAWYEPKGALTLNGGTRLTAPYVAAATITVNGGTALTVTGS